MISKMLSSAVFGVDAYLVEVEVDIAFAKVENNKANPWKSISIFTV